MNSLVSYAETSSEDEDKCSNNSSKGTSDIEKERCSRHDNDQVRMVNSCPHHNLEVDQQIIDLPITDESDDQSGGLINLGGCHEHLNNLSNSKEVSNLKLNLKENHLHSEAGRNLLSHDHSLNIDNASEQLVNDQYQVIDPNIRFEPLHKSITHATANLCKTDEKKSHLSFPKDLSATVLNDTNIHNISNIYGMPTHNHLFSNETHNLTEAVPVRPLVESETTSSPVLNRKRKLSCDSDKRLQVPDAIRSMFHDKQTKWVDDPTQHGNRSRSFPHLEGNWATHVFIPVAKAEPFVRFVNHLLELLIPQTFQMLPEFHVSLSRTVAIRYHWIESLIETLRENLKCMKSCISDLTMVKLFTNDEKTRTFVSIELCQDDREFLDYVKAVDKSFAEFKLPAYYKNPSFHISVGWCLGDAVERISNEKLLKAQEMLGDFQAASPDLSFVYVHEICCQSGCKSFVITLQDS